MLSVTERKRCRSLRPLLCEHCRWHVQIKARTRTELESTILEPRKRRIFQCIRGKNGGLQQKRGKSTASVNCPQKARFQSRYPVIALFLSSYYDYSALTLKANYVHDFF